MKGLLKDAVRDLLPPSVLERDKSPYTPHPDYSRELQRQGLELTTQPSHTLFDIISHQWLSRTANKPIDQLTQLDRRGLSFALEAALWLELYRSAITTT